MLQGATILEEGDEDVLVRMPKANLSGQAPAQRDPASGASGSWGEPKKQVVNQDQPIQVDGKVRGVGYKGPQVADAPTRSDIEKEEQVKSQASLGKFQTGAKQEALAEKEIAESEIATAKAKSKGEEVFAKEQERLTAKFVADREARMLKMNNAWNDINLNLQNGKIDPQRYWNSRSGFQKAGLILGTFLAGIGANENQVLKMIDKEIDRDVQAQVMDYRNRGDRAKNLFSALRAKLGSDDKAALMTMKAQLATIKAQIGRAVQNTKNPKIAAQAVKATGLINQKIAEAEMKEKAIAAREADKKISQGTDPGVTGRLTTIDKMLTKSDKASFVHTGRKGRAGKALGYQSTQTPAEVAKLNNQLITTKSAVRKIDIILGKMKSAGRKVPFTKARAQAQTLAKQLLANLSVLNKLGVLQETDIKFLGGVAPQNPLQIWNVNNQDRFEALRQDLVDNLKLEVERHGIPEDPNLMPRKFDTSRFSEWRKKFKGK